MTRRLQAALGGLLLCALFAPRPAAGQNVNASASRDRAANTLAPAPVPPATVSRTPDGGITVRAVRIPEPIHVDGRLDEDVYRTVPAISDFVQQEPQEGAPATERTDAWIFFDDRNIYVAARCFDSHPEREIANEMRRDGQVTQNENFTIIFDTFHDKRNGFMFETNPLGALRDTMSTDETNQNQDWNTVWDVRTERTDKGWTAEYVIPFKSLRYGPGTTQTWGVNIRRVVKWKNEMSFLSAPPAYLSQRSIINVSLAATMVGLEVPSSRSTLELKPYGISGLRTDLKATPAPFSNQGDESFGADAKYGVTKALTLDLTYNTDFAQVEDDTQQVNLTRFNLQFPERRDFFLEGQGIFGFGGAQSFGGGPGGGGAGGGSNPNNTPVLFFSRRIGLNGSPALPIPIAGGGRLTGQAGPYSIGLLNIQAKNDVASSTKATNFSVFRLKRSVLRRSNVGLLYTRRMETDPGGAPRGETYGLDGLYSLSPALNVNWYYAKTNTRTLKGRNDSYLASFDYSPDRYGLQIQRLKVGENFDPQVGFLRRTVFGRNFLQGRFSPRPARRHWKAIRRFIYQGNVEYIDNNKGRLDFREQEGQFEIEMQNSDRVNIDYTRDYEFIPAAFDIATGVTVPVAGYKYQNLLASYMFGTQHFLSGSVRFQQGSLYGGTKRSFGMGGGRLELTSQLVLEPSISYNKVDLPFGKFTTLLVTDRTTYMFSPRSFASALVQYSSSSHTLTANARFRWEYRPGSELFVVYSDGRDTTPKGFPTLVNRAFIVKITKLFRL